MKGKACCLLWFAICLALPSCDRSSTNVKGRVLIQGAGATFPAPLYKKWIAGYTASQPGQKFLYQSLGSGAGIQLFTAGQVEFGASDAAMSDEQIQAVRTGGVQLLPLTGGIIVLAYNLPGVSENLKLTREAYTGIFDGTITSWDDSRIAKANPTVQLPKTKVTALHRLGASGTTFVFTQHLAAISPSWKQGPGFGLTVPWPGGIGAKGSDGMTETIQQTPGAIGYLDFGTAQRGKLSMAALQNKAGTFVPPSIARGEATLAGIELPDNLRAWAPDPDAKDGYPIVTFTWLLAHKTYEDPKQAAAVKEFCRYALAEGQKDCAPLGYLPLPSTVAQRVQQSVNAIAP
jgi:phosphate transport system substrate-binding protein